MDVGALVAKHTHRLFGRITGRALSLALPIAGIDDITRSVVISFLRPSRRPQVGAVRGVGGKVRPFVIEPAEDVGAGFASRFQGAIGTLISRLALLVLLGVGRRSQVSDKRPHPIALDCPPTV